MAAMLIRIKVVVKIKGLSIIKSASACQFGR
jgi:hypothetical protein